MVILSIDIINAYLHSYGCLGGDESAVGPDSAAAQQAVTTAATVAAALCSRRPPIWVNLRLSNISH